MVLGDAFGEGESQSGTVSLGGKEGAENVWERFWRNAGACVLHRDRSHVVVGIDMNCYRAGTIERLDRVEHQVEQYLVNLAGIMLHRRQVWRFDAMNLDGLRQCLLTRHGNCV